MKKLDMAGKTYDADKAKDVADQLQASEFDGWKYVAETIGGFGRVLVFDETGTFVGYF